MPRFIKLLLVILLFSNLVYSATLKGTVTDAVTHEKLYGATVYINELKTGATSGSDGSYIIKDVPEGAYTMTCSYLSHQKIEKKITVKKADILVIDFSLTDQNTELGGVSVTAKRTENSETSARYSERSAAQVINVISAEKIEALPDLNVADIMQRVSGVSMTKNNFGSNSGLVIRGMPSRYNSTLVDGVVMPSTSSSGRTVSLSMFGSELVGRVEVIKSLTPDLEGDAIGGTVNIKMKQAPDSTFYKIQLSSGYNQYYTNHNFLTFDNSTVAAKDFNELYGPDFLADASLFPRENLIVKEKKTLPDLNISFAAGHRFFKKKLGAMIAISTQNTSMANTYDYTSYDANLQTNKPAPSYYEHQVYSKNNKNYNGYIKFDYQFNTKNQISLYSSLFQTNELRVREFSDHQTENGGQYIRPIETQTETDNSGIFCTTLKGEHKLTNQLNIDWTLIYASANSQSPDFARVEQAQLIGDPQYLNYSTPLLRDWQWDIDQNMSAYLNANYKAFLFEHTFEFKAGGMYRSKYRKNYANEYHFDCDTYQNYPYPDLLTVPFTNDKSGSDGQQKKGNAYLNPGNYRAWEDIGAAYGMVTSTFGKLQILTGVRFETTYMTNEHNQNNIQIPVASSTFRYFDFFPSLHFTYKIQEQQNLRFSIYRAINRPNYTEVIPYSDSRAGAQSGNPKLRPAYGNCIDLRYEIYPRNDEVFSAGIFYKQIKDAIENITSPGSENTSFQNVDHCINYGLELVAMKNFGNLGISANYTYTFSEVSDIWHDFVYKNGAYDNVVAVYENRPLIGQSPNLFNLSVSYRIVHWGFKSSITYTMQGYNMVSKNDHYNFDAYQATYHDLGFTVEQKMGKQFFLTAKVSNLLNSPVTRYMKKMDNTLIEKSYIYQSYFLGLKFAF